MTDPATFTPDDTPFQKHHERSGLPHRANCAARGSTGPCDCHPALVTITMRPAEVGAMRRLLGRRFSAPCQQDRRTLTIEDVRDLLAIPRTELKAHGLRRVADEARRAATAAILHPWGGPLLRHDEPGLADDWDEYDDDELCDICGADWWTFDRWNDCPSCGT